MAELIYERPTASTTMHDEILHVYESSEVDSDLLIAPAGMLSHLSSAETSIWPLDGLGSADGNHHLMHQAQQPASLRRQVVEAPSEELVSEPVCYVPRLLEARANSTPSALCRPLEPATATPTVGSSLRPPRSSIQG